jgi:hypothetical protein
MSEHDFQGAVIADLAELKTDMRAVKDHLGTLNGKVAAHEEKIGLLQLDQARRQGAESTSRNWFETLKPFIWTIAGMIGVLLIQHGSALLDAITK